MSVLILLLVEYPFGHNDPYYVPPLFWRVLILLLVEYPFGLTRITPMSRLNRGLNPSFSGISFRTLKDNQIEYRFEAVLILLLVEYPFGHYKEKLNLSKAAAS